MSGWLRKLEHESLDREGLGAWLHRHRWPWFPILATGGCGMLANSNHWSTWSVIILAGVTAIIWASAYKQKE